MRRCNPRPLSLGAFLCLAALLPGCTVVAVTATVVGVTASAVGLAADAAVGTARIVGKGVGKAADVLTDEPEPTPEPAPAPETPTASAP